MGGPGTGNGGTAPFSNDKNGTSPDTIRGQLDPTGRISVTTFRGLPRPGEITPEFRAEVERARADAQAPLESEVIPRRYRDGIRRYFDDLEDE